MKTVTVRVTKKDIEMGNPQRVNSCPIARAVKRRFHKRVGVSVCGDLSGFVNIGDDSYRLPRVALKFVDRFDYNKPVKPFSFVIKVPGRKAK